jgi:hypothetical protein
MQQQIVMRIPEMTLVLRASPPRRAGEIPLKVGMPKATIPLFQVADQSHSAKPSTSSQKKKETSQGRDGEGQAKGGESSTSGVVLKQNVSGMQDDRSSGEKSWASKGAAGRERVSFRTNMMTEDELSDGNSIDQEAQPPLTAVERFHARKFKDMAMTSEKKAIHKVAGSGNTKKQKMPIKVNIKGAIKELLKEE